LEFLKYLLSTIEIDIHELKAMNETENRIISILIVSEKHYQLLL
jgi:hypothetical protein